MRKYDFYTECFETEWEWQSDYDEGDKGHLIRMTEDDIPNFIAEQVAKFARYVASNLVPVATRKDFCPFNKIATRNETYVICPHCGAYMTENDWNNTEDIFPKCLACGGKINMKED